MPRAPAGRPGTKRKTPIGLTKQIARKEARKVIMGMSEIKYHDKPSPTAADFNGLIVDLSAVPLGDTDITRDGDKILPTALHFGINILGETFSGIVRLVIFRWIPETVPVPGDIFQAVAGAYSTIEPYYHDFRSKFQVLKDKRYTVSNNGGSEIRSDYFRLPLAKKMIEFEAGTDTGRNKIYACMISDRALASTPGTWIKSRLFFRDF